MDVYVKMYFFLFVLGVMENYYFWVYYIWVEGREVMMVDGSFVICNELMLWELKGWYLDLWDEFKGEGMSLKLIGNYDFVIFEVWVDG